MGSVRNSGCHVSRFMGLLLLLALLLVSCGRTGARDQNREESATGLPGFLGTPGELAEQAAIEPRNSSIAGATFVDTLPHNRVQANSSTGLFNPDWDGTNSNSNGAEDMAYAVYALDVAGQSGKIRVNFSWLLKPGGDDLWIGLANQASQRWDWVQSDYGLADLFEIAEIAPYKTVTEQIFVAIIITGTSPCALSYLKVVTQTPTLKVPVGQFDLDIAGGVAACQPMIVGGAPAFLLKEDPGSGMYPLLYLQAADEDASEWLDPVELSPDSYGRPALDVVDGYPAVAYSTGDNGSLVYRRALDAQGTAWGAPVVVDGTNPNPGQSISMKWNGWYGLLKLAYTTAGENEGEDRLLFAIATDSLGSAWEPPVIVEPGYSEGINARDCTLYGTPPEIAYVFNDSVNGIDGVRYCNAEDNAGTTWNEVEDVYTQAESVTSRIRNVDLCHVYLYPSGIGWFIEDLTSGSGSVGFRHYEKTAEDITWYDIQALAPSVPGATLLSATFDSQDMQEGGGTAVIATLNLAGPDGEPLVELLGINVDQWAGYSTDFEYPERYILVLNETAIPIAKGTSSLSMDFNCLKLMLGDCDIFSELNAGGTHDAYDPVRCLRAYCIFGEGDDGLTNHAVFGYLDFDPCLFESHYF